MTATCEPEHALQVLVARVEQALQACLPLPQQTPQELHRAMHYAVLGGGKRLRPLLVYAAAHALGHDSEALDIPACAVELIHAYSLVHDDLPAMDDDQMRRGQPTCHVVFGQALAILVGDALQAQAFRILADARLKPESSLAMLRTLGYACGPEGMAGGQALDLDTVGHPLSLAELEHMHRLKTGALIQAAVRLGALVAAADEDTLAALDRYANAVGLAFQIRDDILDVESASNILGKTVGKDAAHHKPTFPSMIGMQASQSRLTECLEDALSALTTFDPQRCGLLRELARQAAWRKH